LRLSSFLLPLVLAASLSVSFAAAVPPGTEAPPYVLPDTEVRELHAAHLNRDYELYVSLPPSYGTSRRSYPVVFVTDAPYAFPVTRAIGARIGGHSKALPEFILVGLAYAKGDTPQFSRRRDYTPSPRGDADAASDMPGRAPVYGEAEAYRRFIADEVFPFVASHYRADMAHKVFAGHSYGSLLGAWILLNDPSMFQGYVLGSPSLWFDHRLLFGRERAYAASHADLPATVYLGAGGFEAPAPQSAPHDPRYNSGENADMVGDMRAFAHALASHHYAGLRLRADVIDGEDHLTVAPILMTRGLLWTLGTEGERATGKAIRNKSN
jgi:predicted alpha/beta superfamily hydrolase